jgi:hypothetical protein
VKWMRLRMSFPFGAIRAVIRHSAPAVDGDLLGNGSCNPDVRVEACSCPTTQRPPRPFKLAGWVVGTSSCSGLYGRAESKTFGPNRWTSRKSGRKPHFSRISRSNYATKLLGLSSFTSRTKAVRASGTERSGPQQERRRSVASGTGGGRRREPPQPQATSALRLSDTASRSIRSSGSVGPGAGLAR